MKLLKCGVLFLCLCLTGCMTGRVKADLTNQINVFGVELYSSVDYLEIDGVRGTDEPCLKGYERSFDQLEITIGYGFDKKIRKITTRNPGTGIFGILPGMTAEAGKRQASQAGLTEDSPYRYLGKDVSLTLLVDGNGKVFGITVEEL